MTFTAYAKRQTRRLPFVLDGYVIKHRVNGEFSKDWKRIIEKQTWRRSEEVVCLHRYEFLQIYAAEQGSDTDSDSDSSDDELIDGLELALLSTMLPQSTVLGPHLNYADVEEDRFEHFFRSIRSARLLHLSTRTVCPGPEALLILLRRLSYPNRWCDLQDMFGRSQPELSMIFNEILSDIYDRYGSLLESLDLVWLDPQTFSHAIFNKDCIDKIVLVQNTQFAEEGRSAKTF
ncbi:hypothetical protein AC249_AIPGENE107 [Exaiptasia diaphana]|nr:hypothetical protein AC249_AIPGENE107 [Exaiptasia diaphana]